MSDDAKRFIFSGHAVGAAAQFHRLEHLKNLRHVVPTLGASVLPPTGGLSEGHAANYCFHVEQPRKRALLSVDRIYTMAAGRTLSNRYETEVLAEIDGLAVVEKLHVDSVRLHMLASRTIKSKDGKCTVSTQGSHIDGMQLGRVRAKIELDTEPLTFCASADQLDEFFRTRDAAYRKAHAHRFVTDAKGELENKNGLRRFSLVRKITLTGRQDPEHPVTKHGYTITWEGFGRIILGEVLVKGNDRRVTMLRLAMGSDAGGTGTVGDGGSNGQTG